MVDVEDVRYHVHAVLFHLGVFELPGGHHHQAQGEQGLSRVSGTVCSEGPLAGHTPSWGDTELTFPSSDNLAKS